MRIGILTYHYVFNEGALWQASSLCRAIRERFPGHTCEIIDYRHQGKYESLRCQVRDSKAAVYEGAIKDYLGNTPIIDSRTGSLFRHLAVTYDIVIVGSDIIWQFDRKCSLSRRLSVGRERISMLRPDRSTPYRFLRDIKNWVARYWAVVMRPDPLKIPFPNAYWIDPVGPYKKSTFAASVGYSDVERIPEHLKPAMINHLVALDTISVRDHASLRFVERLVPEKASRARITPDPTWLFQEAPMEIGGLLERHGLGADDRLAGVLFPPNRFYGERMNKWVLPLLKAHGFKTVSVIDFNPRVDINLAAETLHPFEWWAVISRLDFLFTVRTHPTIAALKYETPFANVDITAMLHRSTHSKSRDMLETFGLEACCLHRRADFSRHRIAGLVERCLNRSWDWGSVARQREDHQQAGLDTLAAIIGEAPDG